MQSPKEFDNTGRTGSSETSEDYYESVVKPLPRSDNASLRRTLTQDASVPEASDYVNLPYRTITEDANMDEYVQETMSGHIARTVTNVKGNTNEYQLVTFTLQDPENPKNWSKKYKWYCTMVVALTCFTVAFNSAVITADIGGMARDLDVSEEVALLSVTLFVIGFGVGPMAFAPLSEIIGRRIIYAVTLFIAVIFVIPGTAAKNITRLLVTRAIDGIVSFFIF